MVQINVPSKNKDPGGPHWSTNKRCQGASIVIFVISLGFVWQNFSLTKFSNSVDASSTLTLAASISSDPVVVHRETIQEIDVLFAEPQSERTVQGILFVAHGCSHSHTDWFTDCEGCIGLPEEQAIVQIGLDHGLVVVAISSTDRTFKCWSLENDIEPVGRVLQELSKRYQTTTRVGHHGPISIVAFGASSGGAFVSGIGTPLKQQFGLAVNIFLSQIAATRIDKAVSCQVYITMNRDQRTNTNANLLVDQGTTSKIRSRHIRLPSLPIRPNYFSSRVPGIDLEESTKMVKRLQTEGFLDKDGYLLRDPRRSDWREALRKTTNDAPPLVALEKDSLVADESAISEVMNVAYGMHEMTRDGVKEGLEFCLKSFEGTVAG